MRGLQQPTCVTIRQRVLRSQQCGCTRLPTSSLERSASAMQRSGRPGRWPDSNFCQSKTQPSKQQRETGICVVRLGLPPPAGYSRDLKLERAQTLKAAAGRQCRERNRGTSDTQVTKRGQEAWTSYWIIWSIELLSYCMYRRGGKTFGNSLCNRKRSGVQKQDRDLKTVQWSLLI